MKELELIETFCRLDIIDLHKIFGVANAFDHVLKLVESDLNWSTYFLQLEMEDKKLLLQYLETGQVQWESNTARLIRELNNKSSEKS